MGDSIFVHAFGAYFGMAVSFVLFRKDTDSDRNGPSYTSDLFSMIGEFSTESALVTRVSVSSRYSINF